MSSLTAPLHVFVKTPTAVFSASKNSVAVSMCRRCREACLKRLSATGDKSSLRMLLTPHIDALP